MTTDVRRAAVSAAMSDVIGDYVVPVRLGPDRMPVRHPIRPEQLGLFDPFLYIAHFGPRELRETDWGFGPHPHRGFETVTYMLSGAIEHRDSTGAHAVVGPGEVQWMTAGGGIIHSEQPPDALRRDGGVIHGFQIWLNLPAELKRVTPDFSIRRRADIPETTPAPGVKLRVIGGAGGGVASPTGCYAPIFLWHATLAPGARWRFAKARGWRAFAYAFSPAEAGRVSLFDPEADGVTLRHDGRAALDLLVMGGRPIAEPIVSYGPFVMNTREEIVAAVHDYQSGRMGVYR